MSDLPAGGEVPASLPPLPHFERVDALIEGLWFKDRWATQVTRAIENQLDMLHLPFVHRTTIGRFIPAKVEVMTREEPDRIRMWQRVEASSTQPAQAYLDYLAPNL